MKSISKKVKKEKYLMIEKAVKFAIKYGYANASRKYGYSRQILHIWAKKYDGTYKSLIPKSTRPHSHPNQHTKEELELINNKYKIYKHRGLAHVYVKLLEAGYSRSYGSFRRQLNKHKLIKKEKKRRSFPKDNYQKLEATYPGEYVEIDVKYVPKECIGFKSTTERYYQITSIDLYSRKRVLQIVNEHSSYETAKFVHNLEEKFGFKIDTIQTDNGSEFVNNAVNSDKKTFFQKELKRLGINHITTRPYSPWQNGVVERSHREDGKNFYNKEFKSEEHLYKAMKRYNTIYNNTHKLVLNLKTPNQMVEEYYKNVRTISF